MRSDYIVRSLTADSDRVNLVSKLGFKKADLLGSLVRTFSNAGCKLCIEESAYIDRDFSSAYAAFYATVYHAYTKYCRRLHFFATGPADLNDMGGGPEGLSNWVARHADDYLGYIVLRPLGHAPVSHAVVCVEKATDEGIEVSVRSTFSVHLLGVELKVTGVPLTEQDTRTGACAQAAIWTAGRHLHSRHYVPWFSMTDITEAALRPVDSELMRSLPAGSDYLTADSMVRALGAMGERTKVYGRDPETREWEDPPERTIARYVDSGIPVIIGLVRQGGATKLGELGHAVVAIGMQHDRSGNGAAKGKLTDANVADRVTHFIVNDDQRGIYKKLPLRAQDEPSDKAQNEAPDKVQDEPSDKAQNESPDKAQDDSPDCIPYNLAEHAEFVMIPLPNKVFMTGEIAEKLAWAKVRSISEDRMQRVRRSLEKRAADKWDVDPDFYAAVESNLVARTYLTYGWKYKQRALKNSVIPKLKRELLLLQFPRFVWVTEFSLPTDVMGHDQCKHRVRAHVVVDATGSRFWESVILTHVPGIVVVETFDVTAPGQTTETILRVAEEDSPYFPKIRGENDYGRCAIPGG